MIHGFVLLLIFQLSGEAVSRSLALPVPGPVLGLVLLLLGLQAYQRLSRLDPEAVGRSAVGRVANGLLQNLALLFVPAGVGVVQHLGLLEDYALAITAAVIGSTALTLVVTVLVFTAVARRADGADAEPAS
jgi:putative effector of murein hydrolase LrgA (UPF0299 family)